MLKEKIDAYKEKSAGKVPQETKDIMAQNLKAVADTMAGRSIPSVGDQLPAFNLSDQNGSACSLSDLTNGQSLVVTFFRGDW